MFASLGRAMSFQWLLGYGMYLNAWFKILIHPLKFDNCLSIIAWMDADVQLISCWEECFFRRKGKLAFFFPFLFFFPRHIFYLYVCIKDCQEMHLVPKSRISHSSSQLTAFQALFFVISAQISCRQSSLDRWPTPHGKKKNHFLINARKNGTYGIFRAAPTPAFYFILQNSFSD